MTGYLKHKNHIKLEIENSLQLVSRFQDFRELSQFI